MTLSDFRDELKFNLENRADSGLTDARLNRWINWAYLHMSRPNVRSHEEHRTRYDFALTLNGHEYDLSVANTTTKVLEVVNVTYYHTTTPITETATRTDLKPRTLQWMESRLKPSGPPAFFALTGNGTDKVLIIDKLPTAAEVGQMVRVTYWKEPALLSADGDTTDLSQYWDMVMVAGSLFWAKWFLGYREEAVADGQFYQQMINETVLEMNLGAEDTGFRTEIESETFMDSSLG
jgi:hypothetical protein